MDKPMAQRWERMRGLLVKVQGVVGRTKVRVEDVALLRKGSIVRLSTKADAPIEVTVGGRVLAYGEVMTLDGRYALRLPEGGGPAPGRREREESEA